jgi:hypothetical protein
MSVYLQCNIYKCKFLAFKKNQISRFSATELVKSKIYHDPFTPFEEATSAGQSCCGRHLQGAPDLVPLTYLDTDLWYVCVWPSLQFHYALGIIIYRNNYWKDTNVIERAIHDFSRSSHAAALFYVTYVGEVRFDSTVEGLWWNECRGLSRMRSLLKMRIHVFELCGLLWMGERRSVIVKSADGTRFVWYSRQVLRPRTLYVLQGHSSVMSCIYNNAETKASV